MSTLWLEAISWSTVIHKLGIIQCEAGHSMFLSSLFSKFVHVLGGINDDEGITS